MLFHPINKGIKDIKTYLGLKIIQKSVNNTRRINKKANPNPIKETNHHLSGLR
jgi:hypothetical protein